MVNSQNARQVLLSKIPPLNKGPNKTRSSALHKIKFVGPLRTWDDFEDEVRAVFNRPELQHQTTKLAYKPSGRVGQHNIDKELVYVGDETGVQGRFQQNIGQAVTAVFGSLGYDLKFGDAKCSDLPDGLIPDVIIMDSTGQPKAVGELKVPWILKHNPALMIAQQDNTDRTQYNFRQAIGQIARYMKNLRLRYGFFSTYEKHIFLKQELVDGEWTLFYSSVYQDSTTNPAGQLAIRQCFFFLGVAASEAPPAENLTINSLWARK